MSIIKTFLFIPIFIIGLSSFGQVTYQKKFINFGGQVVAFSDYSSIIAGGDIMLKIDNYGNPIWTKQLSVSVFPLLKTTDDKLLMRHFNGLTKVDSSGNIIWHTYYAYDPDGYWASETRDKGFIVVINDYYGPIVFKVDSSGIPQWSKKFTNDTVLIRGQAAIQTDDGGYLIGGSYVPNSRISSGIYYTMKLDSLGNLRHAYSTVTGYPIGGRFYRTSPNSYIMPGNSTIMNFDSTGYINWERNFSGYFFDGAMKNNNRILLLGMAEDSLGMGGHSYIEIDTAGAIMNVTQFDVFGFMNAYGEFVGLYSVDVFPDRSAIIIGGFANSNDMYVIRGDTNNLSGCYEIPVKPVDSLVHESPFPITIRTAAGNIGYSTSAVSSIPIANIQDSVYCSNITLVKNINPEVNCTIFPNPFHSTATIRCNATGALKIYNSLGTLVREEKIKSHSTQFNAATLANGIYYYLLLNDKGIVVRGKFIIE